MLEKYNNGTNSCVSKYLIEMLSKANKQANQLMQPCPRLSVLGIHGYWAIHIVYCESCNLTVTKSAYSQILLTLYLLRLVLPFFSFFYFLFISGCIFFFITNYTHTWDSCNFYNTTSQYLSIWHHQLCSQSEHFHPDCQVENDSHTWSRTVYKLPR